MKIVIFDLYDTLTKIRTDLNKLNYPNKKEYYENYDVTLDEPNENLIRLCNFLHHSTGLRVFIITGRLETLRSETINWLRLHNVAYEKLLMRKEGDEKHTELVKEEFVNEHVEDWTNIELVFEDRKKNVEFWRSKGLTCLQVDDTY